MGEKHTEYKGGAPAVRQNQILEYIEQKKGANTKELVEIFGVSLATIRRDLDELHNQGAVRRTHGGAVCNRIHKAYERLHSEKMSVHTEEKRRIGEAASSMIKEGETILLDSGTTTYPITLGLADVRNITVITNDLYIAYNIVLHRSSRIIMTAGVRTDGYYTLVGSHAEDFINDINVDKVFLSADAVDERAGVTNSSFFDVGIKQAMLKAGDEKILVADSSKFDKVSFIRVYGIEEIDTIITDDGFSREQRRRYSDLVKLITV